MGRKVIQIANSTQLISLPRKWAKKYGVKKGEELIVEEQGNALVIKTDKGKVMDKINVDFDLFSPLTAKCALDALYKSGYDEIEINYTHKNIFKAIHERLLQLIGCDIVEQTDNKILVKDITHGLAEEEFDNQLKRIFTITLSMATNSLNAIKSGKFKDLEEFSAIESTNNKLVNYCQRILTKKGYKDHRKIHLYYVVLWYMESIADDLRDLLNLLSEKKNPSVSKEFIKLLEEVTNYFQIFNQTFFKYDKKNLDMLYSERTKIIKNGIELFERKKDDSDAVRLLISVPHKLFDILPTISAISAF